VIIQTALPNHYAVIAATEHDFVGFAERELETRRDPSYPPHARLVNVIVSGLEEVATLKSRQQGEKSASADCRAAPGAEPLDRGAARGRIHLSADCSSNAPHGWAGTKERSHAEPRRTWSRGELRGEGTGDTREVRASDRDPKGGDPRGQFPAGLRSRSGGSIAATRIERGGRVADMRPNPRLSPAKPTAASCPG
jgi:hypothetical protein